MGLQAGFLADDQVRMFTCSLNYYTEFATGLSRERGGAGEGPRERG